MFSFISYFDEKFIFNPHYLNEKLSFIKQKKPIVFDNDKLIADLQVAIGVLNKEGTDYTFPHRSLQEYFAAIYISSLNDDNKMMVYKKILASLTSNAIGRSSRENFYLLLSELDEKSLIEIALIPYFENFTESFDNRNQNSEIIISKFLEIHAVYNAFSYIIKSNELYEFMDVVNKQFTKYRTEYRKGKPNTQEVDDETSKFARNEVAIKDIQPFLIKFTKDVDSKKNQLAKYLSDENKSDKDIISLI